MSRKPPIPSKVELYRKRTASEKVNATFDLFKAHWRVWLRYSLYFMLPWAVVAGMGASHIMSLMFTETYDVLDYSTWASVLTVVSLLVCGVLNGTLTMSLLNIYFFGDTPLEQLNMRALWPTVKRVLPLVTAAVIFSGVALLVTSPVMMLSIVFPPLALLLPMVVIMPFLMMMPTGVIEELNIGDMISRGFKMAFAQFGQDLGLMLLMLLLT